MMTSLVESALSQWRFAEGSCEVEAPGYRTAPTKHWSRDQKSMINLTQFEATIWPVHNTIWKIMTLLQSVKKYKPQRIQLTMLFNPTNATNMAMTLCMQTNWGHVWKLTVEKSQTNATNVTLHLLRQAIWGDIWKLTAEKIQTNETNVTMPLLRQAI